MKKYIIYIGILAVGLLLGWFLFGGSTNTETEHNHDALTETNQMWTCSMHPQIMQPESGDCPICGMANIQTASHHERHVHQEDDWCDKGNLPEHSSALLR